MATKLSRLLSFEYMRLPIFKSKDKQLPNTKAGIGLVLPLPRQQGVELLIDLVKEIRPKHHDDMAEAETRFQAMLFRLQQSPSLLFSVRKALLTQFVQGNLIPALTDSGIITSRGFGQELLAKLAHKILPPEQAHQDLLSLLNRIFYKKSDYVWVLGIDESNWIRFFQILGIQVNLTEPKLIQQVLTALRILSYRLAGLSMEKELNQQDGGFSGAFQPMLDQNQAIIHLFSTGTDTLTLTEQIHFIQEQLYNCKQALTYFREQRLQRGTSLAQTFVTVRMYQMIERMLLLCDLLNPEEHFDTLRFLQYFKTVIRNEKRKTSIGEFFSLNVGMLAYQIAEHKGKRGEGYITTNTAQYFKLIRSAMGGGLIISVIAVIKNLINWLHLPLFWQGIAVGTNYATGFVAIDRTGSTLATKQPAYTASALVSSLDSKKLGGRPDLYGLSITIARVSRSQIASFFGNLIIVFPLSFTLAWLFKLVTGKYLAEGLAAKKLLFDQHPFDSPALIYACFTGFFLFLSGLIAGYVENHVIFGNIAERIRKHPLLVQVSSPKKLNRLANLIDRSAGAIAGSVALGFFLGIAGPLGKFLGIPFDIRHITISAANVSIGLFGVETLPSVAYLVTLFIGVFLVGFINFLVSFALAFYVALKSRNISLSDYPDFFRIIGKYFRRYPKDFILPPSRPRTTEQLMELLK